VFNGYSSKIMNIDIVIRLSLLALLIAGYFYCCDKKYERSQLKVAKFDLHIINELPKLEKTCQFLESNLDTLIAYRNLSNYVVTWSKDSMRRERRDDNCYSFGGRIEPEKIPTYLKEAYFNHFITFGEPYTRTIKICKNGNIETYLKGNRVGYFDGWYWTQVHELQYKSKMNPRKNGLEIIKDTMLNENFRYIIYLHSK